jgi:hypothetical protein
VHLLGRPFGCGMSCHVKVGRPVGDRGRNDEDGHNGVQREFEVLPKVSATHSANKIGVSLETRGRPVRAAVKLILQSLMRFVRTPSPIVQFREIAYSGYPSYRFLLLSEHDE